jgi:hypothetical protein
MDAWLHTCTPSQPSTAGPAAAAGLAATPPCCPPPPAAAVLLHPAGGISPVTRDFVNPEKPWPHLAPLTAATAAAGKCLVPRLPLYPPYVLELQPGRWLDDSKGRHGVGAAVRRLADSSGLVRGSDWCPGQGQEQQQEQEQEEQLELGAAAAAADVGPAASSSSSSSPLAEQPEGQGRLPEQRGDGEEASTSSSGGSSSQKRSSIPTVRARQQRLWQVAMADDGTMEVGQLAAGS